VVGKNINFKEGEGDFFFWNDSNNPTTDIYGEFKGSLAVPKEFKELYFQITVDDGVRFYWNNSGSPSIDSWQKQSDLTYQSGNVLNQGDLSMFTTNFRIEYFQLDYRSTLILEWSDKNDTKSFKVVPASAFFSYNENPFQNIPIPMSF
jgi:hypothetical protein